MPSDIEKKDGSVIVEKPEEEANDLIEVVDEPTEAEAETKPENVAAQDQDDEVDDEIDDEEERRKERARASRERRERQKKAKNSDKMLIQTQQSTIDELQERLAKVENNQEGARIAGMNHAISATEANIEKIRKNLMTTEDRHLHAELTESLTDEKMKLRDLKAQKDLMVKNAGKKTNVPDSKKQRMDYLMKEWLDRTPWFDPRGNGLDTRIATVIDEDLAKEGWDPATDEYWDELDLRLKDRLPHRYKSERSDRRRQSPPVNGIRNDTVTHQGTAAANQFHISKARKEALIEAGVWDDPKERQKYIKRFIQYDKENPR